MKILFVWPRAANVVFEEYDPNKGFFKLMSKVLSFRKPMTFSILAALTPKEHSVKLVEGKHCDINFDDSYDLVGITCTTAYAHVAYDIADEFRKRGAKVVIGGWHASALPDEAKQHADSVVIGEAEEAWPQLLKDAESKNLKPFYIPKRPVAPELIPHPHKIYAKVAGIGIQATRGCPYGCNFCSITNMKFRNIFRMRAIEDVTKEIKLHTDKVFAFQDASLTINPTYTKQLFNEMKGMNKKFFANGNVDILAKDEEFLKLAHDAGCLGWLIGFESVCQKSLNEIGKKTNQAKDYETAIKRIHNYGMIVEGAFVFGFDNDMPSIFDKTDEFVRKNDIQIPYCMILTPYPGTPVYDKLESEGRILTKDWSKYNQEQVVFQPRHMTAEGLLTNTIQLDEKWHKPLRSVERMIKSMRFGRYPFLETTSIEIFWRLAH